LNRWLFNTTICNCYLLVNNAVDEFSDFKVAPYDSQLAFRTQLYKALLAAAKSSLGIARLPSLQLIQDDIEIQHALVKMPIRKDCMNCKGVRHQERLRRRAPLAQIAGNLGRQSKRKAS
jgi:DNA-binding transcriptional LysR family regulator